MKHLCLIFVTLLFVSLLLFSSCGEKSTSPVEEKPNPVLIFDSNWPFYSPWNTSGMSELDSTIAIILEEGYFGHFPGMNPLVVIRQVTDRIYSYCNLNILTEVLLEPGKIEFTHMGIHKPSILLDGFGPAQEESFFILPNGTYILTFIHHDTSDNYNIDIDDSSIRISPVNSHYTHFEHKLYWRYRPNSFAIFCSAKSEMAHFCGEFVDSLYTELDLKEFYYPDSGIVPYKILAQEHSNDNTTRYFIYKSEADFRQVGVILGRFRQSRLAGQEDINISIQSWRNQRY